MNTSRFMTYLAVMIAAVFAVAVGSLATECYNENDAFKQAKKERYTLIIIVLVVSVAFVLGGIAGMVYAFRE